jgi:hypothetical protein
MTPKLLQFESPRKESKDLWFCQLALEVAKGIDHEVYPPNPGWVCGECEYRGMCGELGQETGDAVEARSCPF